jgi:hypothetical protein
MDNAVNPLVEMIGISKSYGAGSPGSLRGEILFRGKPFHPRGPRRSLRAGLSLEHSVTANTVLSIVDRVSGAGFVPRARETSAVRRIVNELKVKLGTIGNAGHHRGDGRGVVHGRGGTGQQGRPGARRK